MMDCKRFRESLDLYVDGELSVEAMAAADAHRRECTRCAMVVSEMGALRRVVRETVDSLRPPADLEHRVRESIRLPKGPAAAGQPAPGRWLGWAAAAMLLFTLGLTMAAARPAGARDLLVAAMDRAVARLAVAQPLELEAIVLCRDCELHDRHGEAALCDRLGHRGALATSDGRLWNIMEQDSSSRLVHDEAMLGQRVRVVGTIYRDAGTIAVDRYEVMLARTAGLPAPEVQLALR